MADPNLEFVVYAAIGCFVSFFVILGAVYFIKGYREGKRQAAQRKM